MQFQQKSIFLESEGDAFFKRNREALTTDAPVAENDPLLAMLIDWNPFPRRVLEIGCANGWRLHRLKNLGASELHGIDPAASAIDEGRRAYPGVQFSVGTADHLEFKSESFDLVIFGFCLYLCDPSDHFRIVAEADRVLVDRGHLCLLDFDPPSPYRNPYSHRPGLFSYKMDFSRLFLAHPHYQLREKRVAAHGGGELKSPDDRVAVTWLTKDRSTAWPGNPWR